MSCCVLGRDDWPAVRPDTRLLPHSGQLHRVPWARLAHHHSGEAYFKVILKQTRIFFFFLTWQLSKEVTMTLSAIPKVFHLNMIQDPGTESASFRGNNNHPLCLFLPSHAPPPCPCSWKRSWRNAKWPITPSRCVSCWRRYRKTAATSQDGDRRPHLEWPMPLLWWVSLVCAMIVWPFCSLVLSFCKPLT